MSGYATTGNYEVVDYVENLGGNYFDTGFIPNQDTRVRCKIKFMIIDNDHTSVFGSGQSYTYNTFEVYLWNHQLEFNYCNTYAFGDTVKVGDVVEIDFNKNVVKYKINDGTWKTITFSYSNFTTPGTMYVFLNRRPTSLTTTGQLQLEYFEVYDNGELIRNYKPVMDIHTDEVGVYETINEEPVTLLGTGTLVPGEPTGEFVDTKTSTRLKVNASKDITQLDYDLAECEDGWFSRYTRVEYITQNGTGARIDTGIQFKDIGYMDLDFQYDVANFTCVCGGATGGGNNYVCWYSNQLHEGRGGNVIDSGNDRIIGHRYRFISKQGTNTSIAYRDGEFLKNYTSYLFSNSTAIMGLFAFGGGGYSGGTQRIYYAEFRRSENGEVLRKFIPCIRKSDSKSGMYDMVTKQFFEGIGETFYPSSKEYHFDYQKYHMYCARPIYQIDIDIADKIDGWFGDYIRCDYIESTNDGTDKGQQMIDTGYYGNLETSYEVKVAHNYAGTPVEAGGLIIGSRESATSRNISSFANYNTVGTNDFGDYSATRLIDDNTCDTNDIIFYNSKNYRYIEHNGEKLETSTVYSTPFTTPYTLRLFGVTPGFWTAHYNFWGKMYYCKIWDGDELVRDYIPCIRRSDLKAGLYDLVTCEFYSSNSGYDFIPGGRQYEFNFIKY